MLWTANTERYADVIEGINDTPENFLAAVAANHAEVAPSQLYALASVLEGCPFINGSPQNTFVPGLLRLAVEKGVLVGGDDFKSGQTKMKSVLVDFLVGAGIKPTSIVSYNHLGNNDGKNLSAPQTFRSKEISKANVVDDMVREREGGGGGEEDEERAFFLIEFLSFFSRDASPEKERKNLNLQKKKKRTTGPLQQPPLLQAGRAPRPRRRHQVRPRRRGLEAGDGRVHERDLHGEPHLFFFLFFVKMFGFFFNLFF